ncbi:MAG: glycosyltransferase family 4 protein [Opitutaceae bacterium]
MLLRILEGVRAARGAGWSCEILLRNGGSLRDQFARFGPVQTLSHPWAAGPSLRAGLVRKFFDRPFWQPYRANKIMRRWGAGKFDLVYNNSATNGKLVAAARNFGCPILTHVHELGSVLRRFITPAEVTQTIVSTDHFIAVSPAAAADLMACGAPPDRVTVVPNFLPAMPPAPNAANPELRRSLGISPGAALVVGCGHIHSIKGTDLFVQMAAALRRSFSRPVNFVWVGGETDLRFAHRVRKAVKDLGLASWVRFVGPVDNAEPWFAASDVVAVTSREESFSLVALEAAALGVPVIGFGAARGLSSILGETPELLVTDLDPQAMAETLKHVLSEPVHARMLGGKLRALVNKSFLADPCLKDILQVVDTLQERGR